MRKNKRGFTLIEVLIALVIIAIALTAAMLTTMENARDTTRMRNTVTAHWVAMNVLSQIQVGMVSFSITDNTLQGHSEMLGKTWSWTAKKESSPFAKIQAVTVSVSYKGHVINSVVGVV